MDLISSLNRPFTERGLFSEALLYVDNGAAEAIHANVGLKGLAGAIFNLVVNSREEWLDIVLITTLSWLNI
jgi:hypothetical protein